MYASTEDEHRRYKRTRILFTFLCNFTASETIHVRRALLTMQKRLGFHSIGEISRLCERDHCLANSKDVTLVKREQIYLKQSDSI